MSRHSSVTHVPLLARRGGSAPVRKRCVATLAAQTGWWVKLQQRFLCDGPTTPSAPLDASRHFLDVANAPPGQEGQVPRAFGSRQISLLILLVLSTALPAFSQDPRTIVEESQKRSVSSSQRYEGTLRVVDAKSKVSEKRWQFDRIGSHGDSKSVLRFEAPAEVKGVALLVVNHPDRSSDQWMWTPAIARERRIAMQDRATRFFGTDFSFEDLEERDTDQFDFRLLGEESIDGAACWKIESRPKKTKVSQYTHSYVWIRKDNYVVAQIENYKNTVLVRRAKE